MQSRVKLALKAMQCVSLTVVMNGKVTAGTAAGAARAVWDQHCCLPRESEPITLTTPRRQAQEAAGGAGKAVLEKSRHFIAVAQPEALGSPAG